MEERFKMLDELISGGYIEPVKPIHPAIPLCLIPKKTANYSKAPKYLKDKYYRDAVSWYAYFLSPFAFGQTRLELAYIVVALPLFIVTSLLGALIFRFVPLSLHRELVYNVILITVLGVISMFFIHSRYYQYATKKIPENRNVFMTILLGVLIWFVCQIPGNFIFNLFAPTTL